MTPTPDEALIAKGKVIAEYTVAKERLKTSKIRALRLIEQLNGLANQLNHYESAPANYDLEFLKTDFQKLLNDLRATEAELANLEEALRGMGVNVRLVK
jgi:hypothetical protein